MEEPVFVKCEPAWSSDTEEPPDFPSAADIKEELFIEQHQLVPDIKEENNVENVALLTVHTVEKAHHCSVCTMMFDVKFDLVQHMLTHSGEKPNISTDGRFRKSSLKGREPNAECEGKVAENITLETDVRRQDEEKPYRCEECNKTFTQCEIHVDNFDGKYCCRCRHPDEDARTPQVPSDTPLPLL
ncbi:zinc finger protein 354C-like [Anabrus simplex]|uniref:zinc finger protein 354C-like n=1 Tax=Anabrus simplex TaxID=316456 RepID=UPI0035A3A0B6